MVHLKPPLVAIEFFCPAPLPFYDAFYSNVDWTDIDLGDYGVPTNASAVIIQLLTGEILPQASDFWVYSRVRETVSGHTYTVGQYIVCPAALGNVKWTHLIQILPLYGSLKVQYCLQSNIPDVEKWVAIELIGYIIS